MVLRDLIERFERDAPVCVMTRVMLENVLSPERLDAIFAQQGWRQKANGLLFSTVADMMGLVAARIQPSVHAAYQAKVEEISVTVKAVYDKLQRIRPNVSQVLVRETAAAMSDIVDATGGALPELLRGYRVKILDGNHLRRTERRLKVLRERNAAPLPGHAAVVLDPQRKLVIDAFPCEDAHAQERTLLPGILETVQPRDLWIADRNFCTTDFLLGIRSRGGYFIIREHGSSVRNELVGPRKRVGRCATGTVYEQTMRLFQTDGGAVEVRRITVVLDEKTRDGDTEIRVLTNLPAKISGVKIADLYRKRWTIETAFGEMAKNLEGEIVTLGYPRAALFGFCMALVAYNVLSVVQAALRGAHGHEVIEDGVSIYYLANEVAHTYHGLSIAIPDAYWTRTYSHLSSRQLAHELVRIASTVPLRRYRKHKRTARKKPPAMNRKHRNHVSTARLLAPEQDFRNSTCC